MKPGNLYRLRQDKSITLMLSSLDKTQLYRKPTLFKSLSEDSIVLFVKEELIPGTYDGSGPFAKQIKELFFLYEEKIWSITSNMSNSLEHVV